MKPSTRRLQLAGCAVLGLLVLGGAARRLRAQNGVEQRFDQLDANGDRKITPSELPAKELFQQLDLDLDGDGAITKPEAVEAVRKGALKDVRGPGGTPSTGATPFKVELAKPAPAEPPVREGPKPVRPGDHGIGRRVGDVAGGSHTLAAIAKGRVVVFALTSTSCPISRKYLPTLEELVASTGHDVAWILVKPVATDKSADTQAAACRFADRFASRATYVHDPEGRLSAAIGAVTITDVVALAADRTLAYHGAIDDFALEKPARPGKMGRVAPWGRSCHSESHGRSSPQDMP